MATTKVTFTLDESAVRQLHDASLRLARSKSSIVREAILQFHDRIGPVSQKERLRMLRALDELTPKIQHRSAADVDREIAEIRHARGHVDR